MHLTGQTEVALIGDPADAATRDLLAAVRTGYRPNVITALAPDAVPDDHPIPLLRHRTRRDDQPTVYVCRDFACASPVTTPEEAADLLEG
jgi:uncharacterized protein YyaL (SSP411 family)